ncbi:MAG: leucine-rich repeat protein [Candidatus Ventricola sp.]
MKFNRLTTLLIVLLMLTLPVCAPAETKLAQDHVELYAEGALPPAPLGGVATYAAVSLEDTLLEGLSIQQGRIDIAEFGLLSDEFNLLYRDLLNAHPELFYVDGSYSYAYDGNTGLLIYVLPKYRYSGAELNSRIAAYNAAVNRIVRDANLASTTVGKLLRINEYFCVNYQYDLSYSIYRPDELFAQGTGVCQAYMLGVRAVLNKLGIPNATVVSSAMNHTWNLVQLGGNWYHLDVTWDDPTPDRPLGACHSHFLRSDTGITATGHHDWEETYPADSAEYEDFFWIDLATPLTALDDTIFYTNAAPINGRFTIYAWRESAGSSAVLSYSPANSAGSYSFFGKGDPVCADESRIYYAVWDKVYSVSRSSGERRLEYVIGDETQRIWRMALDGRMLLVFASSKNEYIDGTIYAVPLEGLSLALAPQAVQLIPGDTAQLSASLSPEPAVPPVLTYESSRPAVASVDENGLITAGLPGRAVITASYADDLTATCEVLVRCAQALVLPGSLTHVGDGALTGIAAQEIVLPEGMLSIGAGAFAGCGVLLYVNLPDTLEAIDAGAFADCPHLTLLCAPDSVGAAYAEQAGIDYTVLEDALADDID